MQDEGHKRDLSYSMDPEEAFIQSVEDKRSHHHGNPVLRREAANIFKKCSKQERQWLSQRIPAAELEKSANSDNKTDQSKNLAPRNYNHYPKNLTTGTTKESGMADLNRMRRRRSTTSSLLSHETSTSQTMPDQDSSQTFLYRDNITTASEEAFRAEVADGVVIRAAKEKTRITSFSSHASPQ